MTKALHDFGVGLKPRSTLVAVHPSELLEALVGLKDVRVMRYTPRRSLRGTDGRAGAGRGPLPQMSTAGPGQRASGGELREPPRLRHPDVVGVEEAPDALHRSKLSDQVLGARRSPDRGQGLPVDDASGQVGHLQVGEGRTVSEVAAELSCDWHTVNDAVVTYGEALLDLRPTAGDWGTEPNSRTSCVTGHRRKLLTQPKGCYKVAINRLR